MNAINMLLDLLARKGGIAYEGEGITQTMHAWQCGQLARAAGATPHLQLASWLHDVGHLLTDLPGTPTLAGIDDQHESAGANLLNAIWGPAVAEPVRLHVQAKRYLVASHPAYHARLSADSVRSLALQGGPMNLAECRLFDALPYSLDAQQLRSWDELAKRPDWFAMDSGQALDELRFLMQLVPRTD